MLNNKEIIKDRLKCEICRALNIDIIECEDKLYFQKNNKNILISINDFSSMDIDESFYEDCQMNAHRSVMLHLVKDNNNKEVNKIINIFIKNENINPKFTEYEDLFTIAVDYNKIEEFNINILLKEVA